MRVLLLSFYFEPDIGPGAFRATAWARAIRDKLHVGDTLDVVTTRPNRYASFMPASQEAQQEGAMTIHRIQLPAHRSGFIDQSRAFLRYSSEVWRLSRHQRYDLVCATSSRLMTAVLASLVARHHGARLFLDIRDLFVDAIGDVLPRWARPLKPLFSILERFAFTRASHINVVSAGFIPYLKSRYPHKTCSVITNGIDDEFLKEGFIEQKTPGAKSDRVQVLYAGNIGDGQGLHLVLPDLARRLAASHEFLVVGDGGARQRLESAIEGLDNVRWQPPVGRQLLNELYRNCDVLFLHLNDLPAFRKVLPSKLFEYAASGKPILAGVAGHAADFLKTVPGTACFSPCQVNEALEALKKLPNGPVDRKEFIYSNQRHRQMELLAELSLR